jgi:hypothetical protein
MHRRKAELSEQPGRAWLRGVRIGVYPELRASPAPAVEEAGDSEEVRRYREFFATHGLDGLPRRGERAS